MDGRKWIINNSDITNWLYDFICIALILLCRNILLIFLKAWLFSTFKHSYPFTWTNRVVVVLVCVGLIRTSRLFFDYIGFGVLWWRLGFGMVDISEWKFFFLFFLHSFGTTFTCCFLWIQFFRSNYRKRVLFCRNRFYSK
jgi:hypothetical protein